MAHKAPSPSYNFCLTTPSVTSFPPAILAFLGFSEWAGYTPTSEPFHWLFLLVEYLHELLCYSLWVFIYVLLYLYLYLFLMLYL